MAKKTLELHVAVYVIWRILFKFPLFTVHLHNDNISKFNWFYSIKKLFQERVPKFYQHLKVPLHVHSRRETILHYNSSFISNNLWRSENSHGFFYAMLGFGEKIALFLNLISGTLELFPTITSIQKNAVIMPIYF